MTTAAQLIKQYPIISRQITNDELAVLLHELEGVLATRVPGDVVELGCYEGTSALFFSRMLQGLAPEKTLYLYDSFAGLPDKTAEDQSASGGAFVSGELKASKARLKHNFTKAGLPVPEIMQGWFYELLPEDMPEQICFAFLDGDFYQSIGDSLELVWPRLAVGGVIVVDDYHNAALPGAKKAVDEFFADKRIDIRAEASLAIIKMID